MEVTTIQIAAIVLVLVLGLRHLLNIRKYPSAPGPALARWTGLWYVWKVYGGKFEKWNVKQHAVDGKIVRVAPNKYSIDDPEAMKLIYGIKSSLAKTDWYSGSSDPSIGPNDNLFSCQDREEHAAMRKRLTPLYSMSSVKHYEPFVDECVAVFLQQFDQLAKSKEVIDLSRWLYCYACDTIGQMTFGSRHGLVDSKAQDPQGLIPWLFNMQWFCTMAGLTFPWGLPFIFLKFGNPVPGFVKFVKGLDDRAEENFAAAGKEYNKHGRSITFYEKIKKLENENPADVKRYRVFVAKNMNVGAGSDTTSIALTSIMYYLVKNQKVWQKLKTEIETAVHDGTISDPVTFDQSLKLPYLQCVIKEGLRIHPSTGLPLWRLVPPGGMQIAGQFFPEKTWVGINSWVASYNKHVYGLDAESFNPDRWDPSITSKDKLEQMEAYNMTFGAGSRTCLGRHISILEINKLIPELVRRFEFELLDADKELDTENNFFVEQRDVRVVVKPGR